MNQIDESCLIFVDPVILSKYASGLSSVPGLDADCEFA